MNIAMYSGFSGEDLSKAIDKKIDIVSQRIEKES
jgi:hypothetical protein